MRKMQNRRKAKLQRKKVTKLQQAFNVKRKGKYQIKQ